MNKRKVTIARGDGIGPEIMEAVLSILDAAKANLEIDEIEIGEKQYLKGIETGISPSAWEKLRKSRLFLKAPITTPRGGGYKSLNVTTRKSFGLYANVRPCVSYRPFVRTKHPDMNVVIIRENEEDLYTGIEYRQTNQVYQGIKLYSRPGIEKIVRYAFEYAMEYHRKKVTCFVKDNIMKLTDGLFHKVFNEIAAEYPDLEAETSIVDIGSARLADTPENFDVIVTPNLYGDIISDVAAQIAGSVGLAGSANIGKNFAMFEAIHGSAPDIAGKGIANPSGLLLAAVMMLVHIHQPETAALIHNAWLKTIEEGFHTVDIYKAGLSKKKMSTEDFSAAVISFLGEKPKTLRPVTYFAPKKVKGSFTEREKADKKFVGADIYIDWDAGTANELGELISPLSVDGLQLKVITNRGIKVYPEEMPDIFCSDHWRLRFWKGDWIETDQKQLIPLLQLLEENGFDVIKTENLYSFNGKLGFSEVNE